MNNENLNPDDVQPTGESENRDQDQVVIKSEVKPPSEEPTEPEEDLKPRLERLGGEPAPDITPEEFARLQQSGQIHIDPRGRVRSASSNNNNSSADVGVSLRKRRAWYGG